MLFLAVFCGFLAENKREHMVEHKRAKAYARALLTDLQYDTSDLRLSAESEGGTSQMIDSLVQFISQPDPYHNTAKLYYYMSRAQRFYAVDWSRATMNQLINSGNLRYFTNDSLVALISDYNTWQSVIISQENEIRVHRSRAIIFRDQILKANAMLNLRLKFKDDTGPTIDSLYSGLMNNADWPVMSKDPALLNNFTNALINTKNFRERLTTFQYNVAMEEALDIMKLLKKEYHLD
jgi:hypothetical protein